jgi:hypothetical protein
MLSVCPEMTAQRGGRKKGKGEEEEKFTISSLFTSIDAEIGEEGQKERRGETHDLIPRLYIVIKCGTRKAEKEKRRSPSQSQMRTKTCSGRFISSGSNKREKEGTERVVGRKEEQKG